jgi:short subunit dehydrogenase-like uncharacterized protein
VVKHRDAGELRFAIAGRNRDKLEAVRAEIGGAARRADILVADSCDQPTIDLIAARTRVLLNTAGPFSISGDAVVDACVRFRTHYVDITGETAWVRGLIDRYHARCAAEGTRIIPFCGFDSVPPISVRGWPFLPAPGEGPSETTMANGWMRCEVIGKTDSGKKLGVLIRDVGDPGNRITTKSVCEAALSIVRAEDRLPGGSARGGVLTPATGLGDVLVERLRAAGMVIEAKW